MTPFVSPLRIKVTNVSSCEAEYPKLPLEASLDEDNPLLLPGGSDGHLEAQQRNASPDQGLQIEVKAAIGDHEMTRRPRMTLMMTRRPRMILMSVLGLVVLSSLFCTF